MAQPPAEPSADLAVTDDAFLGDRLHILQPKSGYRAGVDAVLLAAAVPSALPRDARVLDLGAGVGTVGLAIARRIAGCHVTLVESEPRLADLARRNIARNDLGDRGRVIVADVTAPGAALAALGLAADSYAAVVANPPFHAEGHGTPAPEPIKAQAHAMPEPALDLWVRAMARAAAPGGMALMIHKVTALADMLGAFSPRFGALRILPIHPRDGAPAIRVIVAGRKGSRAPLTLLPGLVLHGDDGHGFTPAAARILRHGEALVL